MIPSREIMERARLHRVPESTVERDYAQNWPLTSLSLGELRMAFKGGTCIKKIYIKDYRFSDDLDFTMLEDIGRKELEERIIEAVVLARQKSGVDFMDVKIEENYNGFEVSIYFKIIQRGGSPMKIKLDMTEKDREPVLLPISPRKVIHDYSDELNAEVLSYSLEEIFSEKVRSLFQRTRPRDLYDVWYLKNRVGMAPVISILPQKFRFKGIDMDINALHSRKEDFGMAWKTSLSHQIKNLPDFNAVFSDVSYFLKKLKLSLQSEPLSIRLL